MPHFIEAKNLEVEISRKETGKNMCKYNCYKRF